MKIVGSVERCYEEQRAITKQLKTKVDRLFGTIARNTKWHYESRIKELESYALKLETGRSTNLANMDDFLACMVVVENSTQIELAKEKIKKYFIIKYQKPPSDNSTTKQPNSFVYDNLRLYVLLKPNIMIPTKDQINIWSNYSFEIQIKTFLQHAWDLAAHELIYKGDEISWSKRRVAYQIKALLEHAEMSIYEIDKLEKSDMLNKQHNEINRVKKIMNFLNDRWDKDRLPQDMIRLSSNVGSLLQLLDVRLDQLDKFLSVESNFDRGVKTLNLSPYFAILQTIIYQDPDSVRTFLQAENLNNKIPIPAEIVQNDIFQENRNKIIPIGW